MFRCSLSFSGHFRYSVLVSDGHNMRLNKVRVPNVSAIAGMERKLNFGQILSLQRVRNTQFLDNDQSN